MLGRAIFLCAWIAIAASKEIRIYEDCQDTGKVFCLGVDRSGGLDFISHSGGYLPYERCIDQKSCEILLKATRDDDKNEVTFTIYSSLSAGEETGHHVFVALMPQPIGQNAIRIGSDADTTPYAHFPGGTAYMAGWETETENSVLEARFMFQPPATKLPKWIKDGNKLFAEQPPSGLFQVADAKLPPFKAERYVFKAALRGAVYEGTTYDFSGPVSPSVVFRSNSFVFKGTGKRFHNSIYAANSKDLPAMLLWTGPSHVADPPAAGRGSGFPVWAIVLIVVIILVLVVGVIVCFVWSAKRRNKA